MKGSNAYYSTVLSSSAWNQVNQTCVLEIIPMNSLVQTIQHLSLICFRVKPSSVANRITFYLRNCFYCALFSLVPFADFPVLGYERILTISEIGHRKRARTFSLIQKRGWG